MNISKKEVISIDEISDQEFSEVSIILPSTMTVRVGRVTLLDTLWSVEMFICKCHVYLAEVQQNSKNMGMSCANTFSSLIFNSLNQLKEANRQAKYGHELHLSHQGFLLNASFFYDWISASFDYRLE